MNKTEQEKIWNIVLMIYENQIYFQEFKIVFDENSFNYPLISIENSKYRIVAQREDRLDKTVYYISYLFFDNTLIKTQLYDLLYNDFIPTLRKYKLDLLGV